MIRIGKVAATAFAAAAVLSVWRVHAPARADAVADFYGSKRLTIYVGLSPGGGYDLYARTIARHIGRHIPGNPDVVVKNRPGAGSMVLANELYNKLPKDGTAIATVNRGIVMEPLFGNKAARFDPTKFIWLGSANNEVSVCAIWRTKGIDSAQALLTRPWIAGGVGAGADTDTFPMVLNNLLGAHIKLVTGYPGGADVNLAIERGEVDGRCGWSWSSVKSTGAHWLKDKKIDIPLQLSTAKHPELPDVPLVLDLARNDRERKVLSLVFARQTWGRPFLAPPGLPADRAKALKAAFTATMKDAKFLADAKKQKLEIEPIDGATVARLIEDLYASPPELVRLAKAAVSERARTQMSKAVIPVETVTGQITGVRNDGRRVSWAAGAKTGRLSVSGSGTKVTIAGAQAKRSALKEGMSCSFTFQGSAAKAIACR